MIPTGRKNSMIILFIRLNSTSESLKKETFDQTRSSNFQLVGIIPPLAPPPANTKKETLI